MILQLWSTQSTAASSAGFFVAASHGLFNFSIFFSHLNSFHHIIYLLLFSFLTLIPNWFWLILVVCCLLLVLWLTSNIGFYFQNFCTEMLFLCLKDFTLKTSCIQWDFCHRFRFRVFVLFYFLVFVIFVLAFALSWDMKSIFKIEVANSLFIYAKHDKFIDGFFVLFTLQPTFSYLNVDCSDFTLLLLIPIGAVYIFHRY